MAIGWHNKKYKFEKVAYINKSEIPWDILEDLSGNEIGDTKDCNKVRFYKVSQLQTRGKGINENTRIRMDNLRKQLRGFMFILIQF